VSRYVLAAGSTINPTEHAEVHLGSLVFNIDTIIGTLIASVIVIGLGLFVRARLTAGVPKGTQLGFETIVKMVRGVVDEQIGIKVAPYLVPIGMALFTFILACNWLSLLPLHIGTHPVLEPPTADVNLVFALALLLFIWQHVKGTRTHKGVGKHLVHVTKGHYAPFAPMWIILQFVDLASLPLRLFGNMFAGGIMVSLLALLPAYIWWIPGSGWKLFDMAIGLLQAYLFVLLTIVYFKEQTEVRDEAH
jgi:F-type H+-transporting ATPase subunit a